MTEVTEIKNENMIELAEWERNGYDDSDFYTVYFDRENKKVINKMTTTTRFGGSNYLPSVHYKSLPEDVQDEIYQEIKAVMVPQIEVQIKQSDLHAINHPKGKTLGGKEIILNQIHRNRPKSVKECTKCNGSGYWVNPKNESDKRTCFSCNGLGSWVKTVKGSLFAIEKGTVAKVHEVSTYDPHWVQFKKYTLTCKTDDGTIFKVPHTKVILKQEPMSDEAIKEKAINLFDSCGIHWQMKYFIL